MTLLPEWSAAFLLVFARVGTLVMLFPGLGERFVPGRVRLSVALLLTLVFLPFASPMIKTAGPDTIRILFIEIAIGLMLGLITRLIVTSLQTAGAVIAQDLGLSFAQTVDPTAGTQGASISNLLVMMGAVLVFTTDLHHLAISAIGASYINLPPGVLPPTSDTLTLAMKTMATGFALAVKIAAPFAVFAIVFNFGLGLLSRLMPSLQVFFLAMPASVLLGMLMLMATIGVIMTQYIAELQGFLAVLNGR
ncbi:MAG: flagellar biosynthetic protein FliR [Beijerinckiaceae bacterium]